MTDPNPQPEVEGAPESARTLLPLAIAPLPRPEVKGYPHGQPMRAWGLYVGNEMVAHDWFMGDMTKVQMAAHLMRRWMGVRP